MVIQKTELSVGLPCSKCKVCIMKAVSKLIGVNQVTVDEEKGKVTVIGTVDPMLVVKAVRKGAGHVKIDSIGEHKVDPPKPKEPEKPKAPDGPAKPPEPCKHLCGPPTVAIVNYDYDAPGLCIIM